MEAFKGVEVQLHASIASTLLHPEEEPPVSTAEAG
jgi:hypothetical protein